MDKKYRDIYVVETGFAECILLSPIPLLGFHVDRVITTIIVEATNHCETGWIISSGVCHTTRYIEFNIWSAVKCCGISTAILYDVTGS